MVQECKSKRVKKVRIVFLTFVLLYFCTLVPPLHAAISRGVGPANGDNIGLGLTSTATLTGTTIGRMIVIVIGYSDFGSPTITSVTISGETDPTLIAAFNMSANGDNFRIYYLANNTAGGDKTINVNWSGTVYSTMIAQEYAGQDITTQPDATTAAVNAAAGNGDPTIGITTATTGDLIITVCSSNGGKPTMPSGYSDLNLSNPGYYANAADNVAAGAAGAKTLIWTDVFDSTWGVTAVAFRAAGVSAATAVRHRVTNQ